MNNDKTVAVIQARMGSTRLPGKVMKDLAGHPVLWHVIDRIKRVKEIDQIVVATTILPTDDTIEDFCRSGELQFFRGSSEDVLSRYYLAATEYQADTIIRITSDCPVIDPIVVSRMVNAFLSKRTSSKLPSYLSNTLKRSFPRGLDAEIFAAAALSIANRDAADPFEREHVTPYIYLHPELFSIEQYTSSVDHSQYRLTLDTVEDYRLLSQIYSSLYHEGEIFHLQEILDLFDRKPELVEINRDVKQN